MVHTTNLVIMTVLFVLLCATFLYARKLRKAFGKIKNVGDELRVAVADFDHGTRSAEAAIAEMNETAKVLSGHLRHAMALRDDLMFLSERGETLADRLDTLVRVVRTMEQAQQNKGTKLEPVVSTAGNQNKVSAPTARVLSQAERSLLTALHEQK